ncbi:MAG: PGF-pre-PGF domain-containing protein, partial [Nanoarchaeota archaeon]|nr:PGF-pre-PGF domain-containing protein [Nanoarchaeota archaeon]
TDKVIWMKIPHFSGVGPEVSAVTTTTPPPSGGGGGGTPSVTYDEQTVGTLAAGSTKAITFTKSATLAVTEITVTVKNKVTNAKIKVDTGSLPSGSSVPSSAKGSVYKYITITKTAMTDNDVSKGIIKFKVKRSWLTEKGYGKDTVALHRYYTNKWSKLTTTKDSEDTTYYYYSSESPGFSTFAITAEKAPAVITPPAEEVPEEEAEVTEEEAPAEEGAPVEEEEVPPEKPPSNTALIITLIAVIIVLAVVGYFVQQKKKKY